MRGNRGITLLMVLITIIVLGIMMTLIAINSVDTWQNSKVIKFKTNMQILQKKVDLVLEEGIDYTNLGSSLTAEQITQLQTILSNDTNHYIETNDTSNIGLRYFTATDIKNVFDLDGLQDEFIINFSIREIISLNGVEKNGVMHYVEYGL